MVRLISITGNSMSPTLRHNNLILISKRRKIVANDVVVVNTNSSGLIVKRVKSVSGDFMYLVGDNPRLESSFCNSKMSINAILGVVFMRIDINIVEFLGKKFLVPINFSLL